MHLHSQCAPENITFIRTLAKQQLASLRIGDVWLPFEKFRFLEMNKHDSRFRIGLIEHHFRIEQVGRSAFLLRHICCILFYACKPFTSGGYKPFPDELQTC